MNYAVNAKYVVSFHKDKPLIIKNGWILVDDENIVKVGKNLDIKGREVIKLENHIVMPGLINTHTHTAMTLFRGYADDVDLNTWLNEHIWPAESRLTREDVEIGTKIASIEGILSGTTTFNSMYWYPNGEAQAFTDTGMRAIVGPPIISGVTKLSESENMIKRWHGSNNDTIRISLNPHAPYTVTKEDYLGINEYKINFNKEQDIPVKIHTHVLESKIDFKLTKDFAQSNQFSINTDTQIGYLDELGILNDDLIAAHVVETNDKDIKLLAERKVGLALNPVSNMKLGNNTPPIKKYLDVNAKIGLGTDGPASNNSIDMFETMKMTSLIQKSNYNNAGIGNAFQTLKLATHGGAKVIGWNGIGAIEEGYKADFIAIDMDKPHLKPIFNENSIIAMLVYSVKSSDITDVMINGRWRLKNKQLVDIDIKSEYNLFQSSINRIFADTSD